MAAIDCLPLIDQSPDYSPLIGQSVEPLVQVAVNSINHMFQPLNGVTEILLTFALLGGVLRTPLRFFPDCPKTAARSAAVFGTPYHTSFPHML